MVTGTSNATEYQDILRRAPGIDELKASHKSRSNEAVAVLLFSRLF